MDFNGRNPVINELAQGRELAKQLQKLLLDPCGPVLEKREFVMDQIISIYNKALNSINLNGDPFAPAGSSFRGGMINTRSFAHNQDLPRPSKKRKTVLLPRRAEKVKLSNGEELPSDGYCWRKYGQKSILGAKFRRGYFRCTHRHTQGCTALKQVQKSDGDPTVFHVIYVGDHTCTPPSHLIRPSASTNPPRAQLTLTQHPQEEEEEEEAAAPPASLQPQLTVQAEEEFENGGQEKFYFRSVSFSALLPASPATSGPDHLPSSPANINGMWTPESYLNSSINGLEFTLEELGIDPNFPFNNPEMFS